MKGGGETGKENYFVIRWLLEDGSQHAGFWTSANTGGSIGSSLENRDWGRG